MADPNTRPHSSVVVDGNDRAPARSMLRAVGFEDEDFKKPQVAVAGSPSDLTPCNMHLSDLAAHASNGINGAGGSEIHRSSNLVPGIGSSPSSIPPARQ